MKFTSAITFLSLSACISPTFGRKRKGKVDEIPSSLCDSIVQCREAYTGEVKLTEDLYCPDIPGGNCAITLNGKQAVLDCNKYMIDGDSSSGKGICIRNGASAINCYVQKFADGIVVTNGGEVNDCQVMSNEGNGILIDSQASSTSKMKISNTYIHDNGDSGIYFFGYGDSPESSETSIEVNNVKSNHNGESGMYFGGRNVKLEVQVKDSETSNNEKSGISIKGSDSETIDLGLDGIISRYNGKHGIHTGSETEGEIKVKGDVNLYDNEESGFIVSSARVKVVVEKRGALNSCGNDVDIENFGGGTFSGNGYTCTNVNPPGVNPPGVNPSDTITCSTCPCTQPQPQ